MKQTERLSLVVVKDGLRTKLIGRTLHIFRTLSSTNDIAKELARVGVKEGTLILAETQTHGKGRLNREWFSPTGGLWFSIILRPTLNPRHVPKLTFVASVAVVKTMRRLLGLDAEVKWPNDVLINGKKVCGILIETSTEGDALNFAVIGVGVNVNFDTNDLPVDLRAPSTTIKEELKKGIDREDFLRALLEEIEDYYFKFSQGEFNTVLSEWRSFSKFLGAHVEVTSLNETIEGWAADVDEDGALVVRLRNRTYRRILSGDMIVKTRFRDSENVPD